MARHDGSTLRQIRQSCERHVYCNQTTGFSFCYNEKVCDANELLPRNQIAETQTCSVRYQHTLYQPTLSTSYIIIQLLRKSLYQSPSPRVQVSTQVRSEHRVDLDQRYGDSSHETLRPRHS